MASFPFFSFWSFAHHLWRERRAPFHHYLTHFHQNLPCHLKESHARHAQHNCALFRALRPGMYSWSSESLSSAHKSTREIDIVEIRQQQHNNSSSSSSQQPYLDMPILVFICRPLPIISERADFTKIILKVLFSLYLFLNAHLLYTNCLWCFPRRG